MTNKTFTYTDFAYRDVCSDKTTLKEGETQKIEFLITPDDLRFYNEDLKYVWEPGEIQVFIGNNSNCTDYKTFELIK